MNDTPWHQKILGGFRRTSDKLGENLTGLFTKAQLDKATLDEIEEALIASDLGPVTAAKVRERLSEERYEKGLTENEVREIVAQRAELPPLPVPRRS